MWSLGCLLAECYSGQPLFMGKSKVEILAKVRCFLISARTLNIIVQIEQFFSSNKGHFPNTI